MIELYNFKPIFYGNSEKEVLFRITAILGTPHTWTDGIQLAKKMDIKFPQCSGINFSQIVPDASMEALDMLSQILQWDPNKRATAGILLKHPFFTKYPVHNMINTPINRENIKKKQNLDYSLNKDISKILDDSLGLSQCNKIKLVINKLKSEGIDQDENSYISNSLLTIDNNRLIDEIEDMNDIFKSEILYENNNINNSISTLFSIKKSNY